MSDMKNIVGILLLIFFLLSCKEETRYELRLFIKNESTKILTIKLFPKTEYIETIYLYDCGVCGGFLSREFELEASMERELFASEDLSLKPYILTAQVFDSILVTSPEDGSLSLKFSPGYVIGYDKNMYADSNGWSYDVKNIDLSTMLRRNPNEFHDYTFSIIIN